MYLFRTLRPLQHLTGFRWEQELHEKNTNMIPFFRVQGQKCMATPRTSIRGECLWVKMPLHAFLCSFVYTQPRRRTNTETFLVPGSNVQSTYKSRGPGQSGCTIRDDYPASHFLSLQFIFGVHKPRISRTRRRRATCTAESRYYVSRSRLGGLFLGSRRGKDAET